MHKKFASLVTIFSFSFSQISFGQENVDEIDDFDDFDTEYMEYDEPFNRGSAVGEESKDYLRAQRRTRFQNWGLAITSTLAGVATFIYVAKKQ